MINMLKQWFDRYVLFSFGGIVLLHGIAWVFQHTAWTWIPLLMIGALTLIVTTRSLLFGFSIAMLEIIIGGHGHLIDTSIAGMTVGLRLVLFVAVMIGVFYHLVIKKVRPVFVLERDVPFLILILAVIIGTLLGAMQNPIASVFDDANSFVTLGYLLPLSMIAWTSDAKRFLLRTFALGATWVAASSLGLIYAFNHLDADGIWTLYRFVRDARLAEVTLLSGPSWIVNTLGNSPWFFRVFEPAQAFVMFFSLAAITMLCFLARSWKARGITLGILSVFLAVDIGGQSRSFWLGLLAGATVVGIATLIDRVKFREIFKIKLAGLGAIVVAIAMLWIAIALPLPTRPDLRNSPYYKGQDDDTRNLAVSSRWNLLTPMMDTIYEAPILGSGFGTSVTFISDDPRVRAINANGEWTTYRFEWGFHDIWIKMGLLGLLAFLLIFLSTLWATWRSLKEKDDHRWLSIAFFAGIVALYVSHAFSPYLNHPIGLGFLIMSLPFFPWKSQKIPSMATVLQAAENVSLPQARKTVVARE